MELILGLLFFCGLCIVIPLAVSSAVGNEGRERRKTLRQVYESALQALERNPGDQGARRSAIDSGLTYYRSADAGRFASDATGNAIFVQSSDGELIALVRVDIEARLGTGAFGGAPPDAVGRAFADDATARACVSRWASVEADNRVHEIFSAGVDRVDPAGRVYGTPEWVDCARAILSYFNSLHADVRAGCYAITLGTVACAYLDQGPPWGLVPAEASIARNGLDDLSHVGQQAGRLANTALERLEPPYWAALGLPYPLRNASPEEIESMRELIMKSLAASVHALNGEA